ncbi:MAG: hypothetical protein AB7G15_19180 [Alphaproteobacteria bacterium]
MTKIPKILAILVAAPFALGFATFAQAEESISDTRTSNHGVPVQTFPGPIYSSRDSDSGMPSSGVPSDNGRISAHEANPTNPGNTSNYAPPPLYMYPNSNQPMAPYYTPPGSAGPQIEIISNEPYFQDDVPPYRR